MINELDEMSDNPNPALTEVLLKSKHQYRPKLAFNTNPKLAPLIIENCNICEINQSSNTGLTDYILENAYKCQNCDCIFKNTNPLIAPLIINNKNRDWLQISNNPNPGLTNFILEHKGNLEQTICDNSNPLLAELIMEIGKDWDGLSANNNPGLTEFLLKNRDSLSIDCLADNDNPGLTDLIIELIKKYTSCYTPLTTNKNPGLKKHVRLCPSNPNIATIDKIRNNKILAELWL
jgi:hypothetical protein